MRTLIFALIAFGLTVPVAAGEEPQRLPEFKVSRAPLGSLGLRLKIDVDGKEDAASRIKSIVVAGVVAHSPAELAGLRAHDVILMFDHHAVTAMTLGEFQSALNVLCRGDDIVLDYSRPKTPGERQVSLRLQ